MAQLGFRFTHLAVGQSLEPVTNQHDLLNASLAVVGPPTLDQINP